ncbi:hypothetical protein I5M32_06010 [Pedobacter sp. SD-b]|uniref:Uncharacterized protein n=1 Tax=Pedobacter segetis TaxID=2793069 RepID=A0ABS1BI74_9SPHI|nr:hypothetical protein [Pedobacter segetis]MBK0382512.1 hypothetical protein [Pedobacter segetis]
MTIKKYLLICYFVFYNYYRKKDNKYDKENKNTWLSALIVTMLPFTIVNLTLFFFLLNYLGIFIPGIIQVLILIFLSHRIFSNLLFKVYEVNKYEGVSQQTEIELNKYSIFYPICFYAISIIFFLIATYLRNGYIIKS